MVDERMSDTATSPEEDARDLLAMLKKHHIAPTAVDIAIGDVNTAGKSISGWSVNEAIGAAIAAQLNRRSPPFRIRPVYKGPGAKDWGLRVINMASRRGDLMVHPRCKALIRTLRNWQGRTTGEDGRMAHAADALRYGLISTIGERPTYSRLRLEF